MSQEKYWLEIYLYFIQYLKGNAYIFGQYKYKMAKNIYDEIEVTKTYWKYISVHIFTSKLAIYF